MKVGELADRKPEETIARLHCEIIKDESARDASLWRFRVGTRYFSAWPLLTQNWS